MSLRIRQIVLAARDLHATVAQLKAVLGVEVCYNDPEVGHFGLENALMAIGHQGYVQFLEVVSPIRDNTTAGRHLDRYGDSGYMLILQTGDFFKARANLDRQQVRIVWESTHNDIRAMHIHPKDIGGAIVSIDQPVPPDSWRWAGPKWRDHLKQDGAQRVVSTTVQANDVRALSQRWASVLGTESAHGNSDGAQIDIEAGAIRFVAGPHDVIHAFGIAIDNVERAIDSAKILGLPVDGNAVTMCGTRFELSTYKKN